MIDNVHEVLKLNAPALSTGRDGGNERRNKTIQDKHRHQDGCGSGPTSK